jgi:adenylate kinase
VGELNLILLGPPGAGKGTQADRLRDDFGLPYIGSGELLRKHRDDGTALGREAALHMERGDLVPDELVVRMILEEIEDKGGDGFLLDGYPRSVAQADALSEALDETGRSLTATLLIDVDDETVIQRLSGRRQCVKSGHLYHVLLDPPKHDNVCDQDGSRLIQRDDDRPETVKQRLRTYHEITEPLIDYYEERGLLRRFDGTRDAAEVNDHIRATLAMLRLEERL